MKHLLFLFEPSCLIKLFLMITSLVLRSHLKDDRCTIRTKAIVAVDPFGET
jgi:hypothetical protein